MYCKREEPRRCIYKKKLFIVPFTIVLELGGGGVFSSFWFQMSTRYDGAIVYMYEFY